jgi:hypothetical protein
MFFFGKSQRMTKRKTRTTAEIKMMMMTRKTATATRSECPLFVLVSKDPSTADLSAAVIQQGI